MINEFATKTLTTFLVSKGIIQNKNDNVDIDYDGLLFQVKPYDSEKMYIIRFNTNGKKKKFEIVSEF